MTQCCLRCEEFQFFFQLVSLRQSLTGTSRDPNIFPISIFIGCLFPKKVSNKRNIWVRGGSMCRKRLLKNKWTRTDIYMPRYGLLPRYGHMWTNVRRVKIESTVHFRTRQVSSVTELKFKVQLNSIFVCFPQAFFCSIFPTDMYKLFNQNICDRYQQWLQLTFMKVEKPHKLNVLLQK